MKTKPEDVIKLTAGPALAQLLPVEQRQPCHNGSCQLCLVRIHSGTLITPAGNKTYGEVLSCQAQVPNQAQVSLCYPALQQRQCVSLYCKIQQRRALTTKLCRLSLLTPAGKQANLAAQARCYAEITSGRRFQCQNYNYYPQQRLIEIDLPQALSAKLSSNYLRLQFQ